MMQIAHSALYIHLETETPRYSSYITYSSILHVEMSDSTPCTPMHTHTHTPLVYKTLLAVSQKIKHERTK